MRPAEGEPDLPGRPVLEQALEPAVAVDLQDAPELGQVGGRVLALAVLGVEVDHRRRGAAAPGPVVDRVAPQPAGLGPAPAGVEHRQRGVVGEDPGRAMTCRRSRRHSGSSHQQARPDPVAQGRAVQVDPLPGEDPGLAVQGQEIGVLGHQHVREQRLGRHPAGDRPLRGGRLHHRLLAGPAAVAGAADHLHPQQGGDDVEHLARVLADDVHGPAAAGAALVLDVDQDLDPRQVRRQGAQVASARARGGRGVPLLLAAASSCAASAAATVCSRSSRPSWSWSGSSFSERRPNRPRCSCRIKSRSFSISACATSCCSRTRSRSVRAASRSARTVSCSVCKACES